MVQIILQKELPRSFIFWWDSDSDFYRYDNLLLGNLNHLKYKVAYLSIFSVGSRL